MQGDLVVDDSRWTTTGYPLSEQSGCWYWISGDITDSPQNTTNNAGSFLRIVIKSINGVTASNNTVMKLISDAATSIFKITLKEYTDDSGNGRGCAYSEVTIGTSHSLLHVSIRTLHGLFSLSLNCGSKHHAICVSVT